jgi:hypothetical protein
VALWKDRLEDDGALYASDPALRRIADAAVSGALQGLRRAFLEGDLTRQWRAQLLLELARLLRKDLRRGAWGRLAAEDSATSAAGAPDPRPARPLARADPAGLIVRME